jgi:acetyl-CoA synthetase
VLPDAASYDELRDRFAWDIPEHYNIGVDVCVNGGAKRGQMAA